MALRMDDPLVARALLFAVERHKDQKDRGGRPYVGHLIRVAENVEGARAQAAALLHDSVEDRKATAAEIAKEFPTVHDLVTILTHTEDEGYTEYILRVSKDAEARAIKTADLEDNMDLTRQTQPLTFKDLQRISKYHFAWCFLKGTISQASYLMFTNQLDSSVL